MRLQTQCKTCYTLPWLSKILLHNISLSSIKHIDILTWSVWGYGFPFLNGRAASLCNCSIWHSLFFEQWHFVVWVVRPFYVHSSSERSESRLSLDVRLLRPDARLDARPDAKPLCQFLATLEKWMQQRFPATTLRPPENDIRPVRPLRYVVRPVVEVVRFPENWQVARVASV